MDCGKTISNTLTSSVMLSFTNSYVIFKDLVNVQSITTLLEHDHIIK